MTIETMAARQQGAPLSPWSRALPALGPFDCLVEVQATGICYSDIHMIDNDWDVSRYPLVPGHEVVGTILETGTHLTHLKTGDRVGIGWQASSCLTCQDCLKGNENLCSKGRWLIEHDYGGFASHVVVDGRFCFALPATLPTEQAGPLLCAGTTVYSALRYAGMTSGQDIGIIGFGGLGHLALQFAHKLGNRVTIFTRKKEKADDALTMGADRVVVTENGIPQPTRSRSLNILLSTIAHHCHWEAFLDLLDSDGTLTFVGVPNDPMQVSIHDLLSARRRIMASPIGGRAIIHEMLAAAAQCHILPVVETFPLREANRAIKRIRENAIRYRAVLIP